MDKDFELSKHERLYALLLRNKDLSKSNEYNHRIHPVESAAVEQNLNESDAAADAKKKAAAAAAAKTSSVGDADASPARSVPGKPTASPTAATPGPASAELRRGESTSASGEAPPETTKS